METAIEFANKVRAELSHLTSEQVADLTDGLEADIASSLDDGADIGSAEKYATDLLAAAGMTKGVEVVPNAVDVFINKARRWFVSISDLEPAWWIFRAWVATQLIGWLLFREQSSSPGYLEWRNMQWGGVVVLGVMLYGSVRIGRAKPTKWKTALSISHVVLAVAGLAFMFVSPRGESGTIGYLNPPPGQSSCQFVSVPDVVGLSIADAKSILTSMGMAGTIFDQDAMTTLAQVPDDVIVLQQDPLAGNQVCRMSEIQYMIDLVVDLAAPMVTTLPSDITTTTTVLPPERSSTTTTSVKPKATTTTSP
jgi:PASTA domain